MTLAIIQNILSSMESGIGDAMKNVTYTIGGLLAAAILLYCSLVWYYAFVRIDPWGAERYLSMRGLEDVNIYGDWNLQSFRCARPSKLIGAFSQYTSINVLCEEFDVADIVGCFRLKILNVNHPGMLKNFALLKHMDLFLVAGCVDEPIMGFRHLHRGCAFCDSPC